jgi:tripartite-type tricarboxylate transporter receptor subunit TctC
MANGGKRRIGALLAALALASPAAAAEPFPTRPVRIIVPSAPGSVTDIAVRMLAQSLAERWGQPVLTINRAGANGVLATEMCAKSEADGHTLCVVSQDSMSYVVFTMPSLPYDPARDLKPVSNLYFIIDGLIAKRALPVRTFAEFRALAIAQPGKLNFGTMGPRTLTDAFRLWLGETWHTAFVGVPYKGGGEVITALLSGNIDVARIGVGNMTGQLSEGGPKVLAIRSAARSPLLPDVPTMDELKVGPVPGGRPWFGLVAPAGVPDAIVAKVNADVAQVFAEPKFVAFLRNQFIDPAIGPVAGFADFLKQDRTLARVMVDTYLTPKAQ